MKHSFCPDSILWLMILVMAALVPRAVWAAPSAAPAEAAGDRLTEQARRRFDEGIRAYGSGDYEQARVAFLQTLALKPLPEVLVNLGLSEVQSGHTLSGARHLAEYLRGTPALKESADSRAAAIRWLGEAERRVGKLWLNVDPRTATVQVDGQQVGQAWLGHLWYVRPGAHSVVVSFGDRSQSRQVVVAAGQIVRVQMPRTLANPRTAASARSAIEEPTGRDRTTAAVLTATGAALSVGAAAAWIGWALKGFALERDAERQVAQIREAYGPQPCATSRAASNACAGLEDTVDRAVRSYRLANAAVGATVLLSAATAAAFYVWLQTGKASDEQHGGVDLSSWGALSGQGMEVGLRF